MKGAPGAYCHKLQAGDWLRRPQLNPDRRFLYPPGRLLGGFFCGAASKLSGPGPVTAQLQRQDAVRHHGQQSHAGVGTGSSVVQAVGASAAISSRNRWTATA